MHDGASARRYAALTVERHQGRERRADGFHHPAQDQASRHRSAQHFGFVLASSKTGERRGRHHLPVGEEARLRGEVRAPHQGKGRDRKGLHLSQQPTFGGDTGDNGRCGTLFGQQDIGAWQHCVNAGLRKGEHGEENGGNEPDGWGVLI